LVGRPSLAPIRREQLMDAVEASIIEAGVDGTTIAGVAHRAGVQASLVHHYLGTRDEMLDAAVQRALHRIESIMVEALHDTPAHKRVRAQIDVLFSGQLESPAINQLIDQLVAASYLDPRIRDALRSMYLRLEHLLRDSILDGHPTATPARAEAVACAVLSLAHASATFSWLAFDPSQSERNRTAALTLVGTLGT
ncbi:MAG: TetR family transcriptional regulator, partial [Ilumatobacteraceae bacterium]